MATKKAEIALPAFAENTVAARIASGAVELPEALVGKVDLADWMRSLVLNTDYEMPDPDMMATQMLLQQLSATSVEDLITSSDLNGLNDAIDNFVGASMGPVDIVDLVVVPTDFEEGAKTYMIMSIVDLDTRIVEKYSCGAKSLQVDVIVHIACGNWPLQGQFVRTKSKDKGGRHILKFYPVD